MPSSKKKARQFYLSPKYHFRVITIVKKPFEIDVRRISQILLDWPKTALAESHH